MIKLSKWKILFFCLVIIVIGASITVWTIKAKNAEEDQFDIWLGGVNTDLSANEADILIQDIIKKGEPDYIVKRLQAPQWRIHEMLGGKYLLEGDYEKAFLQYQEDDQCRGLVNGVTIYLAGLTGNRIYLDSLLKEYKGNTRLEKTTRKLILANLAWIDEDWDKIVSLTALEKTASTSADQSKEEAIMGTWLAFLRTKAFGEKKEPKSVTAVYQSDPRLHGYGHYLQHRLTTYIAIVVCDSMFRDYQKSDPEAVRDVINHMLEILNDLDISSAKAKAHCLQMLEKLPPKSDSDSAPTTMKAVDARKPEETRDSHPLN